MKKNNMREFSKEDLYLIRNFIETNKDVNTMLSEVDIMIYEKEDGMNSKLTIELMEQLHFFDSEMFDILKSHGIKNIQDLIDSDLGTWGLTHQRRKELEEAKIWYDFSRIESDTNNKVNKKRK